MSSKGVKTELGGKSNMDGVYDDNQGIVLGTDLMRDRFAGKGFARF